MGAHPISLNAVIILLVYAQPLPNEPLTAIGVLEIGRIGIFLFERCDIRIFMQVFEVHAGGRLESVGLNSGYLMSNVPPLGRASAAQRFWRSRRSSSRNSFAAESANPCSLMTTLHTQMAFRIWDLRFRICSSRTRAAIRTRCAPIRNSRGARH